MAAIEEACSRLLLMGEDELRADTSHLLKNHCPHNKSNISKEHRAIKELREDQTRAVLMVDMGVAVVVMDKQDYTDKGLPLLRDTSTSKTSNKKVDSVTLHTGKYTQPMLSP